MSTCLVCREERSIRETGMNWNVAPETGEVGICPFCFADAKLGRLVRGMPGTMDLQHAGNYWHCVNDEGDPLSSNCETPEESLIAAGVKEGEG